MESYCSAQAGLICDIKSGLLDLIRFGYLYGDKLFIYFFSQLLLPKTNDAT